MVKGTDRVKMVAIFSNRDPAILGLFVKSQLEKEGALSMCLCLILICSKRTCFGSFAN